MRKLGVLGALACALLLAACGDDDDNGPSSEIQGKIEDARKVRAGEFPPSQGRTLQDIAATLRPGPKLGLATNTYVPGENRLAYGVIDEANKFVYGRTAVYVAPSANAPAEGPYPAPPDSLIAEPAFRSSTAAAEEDAIAAIYHTRIPFEKPGRYEVLAVVKTPEGIAGAADVIKVERASSIPEVGERAPAVTTDTVASARGDIESIETRNPPDTMHETSFKDVVGKRPVVLLFSTPQLCQSRVCGPVTDVAEQLKREFGDRATFIHQEVFVDNRLEKGYRPPLREFGLETEPWLFTVKRDGRVAARLEGSFGQDEFRKAIEAAL
jgi:hypothetical protein